MEEIKVSEMLQADSINKDDSVMIIQEGVNKKASGSIQTATGTSLSLTSVADTCKVKSNSKNLYNNDKPNLLTDVSISSATSQISSTSGATSLYIPIKANTTYTISKASATSRFIVGTCSSTPAVGVTCTGIQTGHTSTSLTITSGASDTYLVVWYYLSSQDTGITEDTIRAGIQIEEGETATSYNPYNTEVKLNNSIYSGSFAVGDWMVTTGEPRVTSGRVRCADKLQVEPNTEYIFDTELGNITRFVLFYDENQAYLNTYIDIKANNGHFTTSATTKYITFYVISTEATIYDNYVIVEATKKASMQSIALIPQEEKIAFSYNTNTNLISDGSVTIEYNTKSRLLNNNDTLVIKEYIDKTKEELLENDYDVYSTDEKRVGTWIDGKPLYRKIIQMTLPNATTDGSAVSTTTTVGSVSLDFKRIVCATAITSTSTLSLPFLNAAHHLVKAYFTANRTLNLSNEVVAYNGSTVYIEVEYTKTAD